MYSKRTTANSEFAKFQIDAFVGYLDEVNHRRTGQNVCHFGGAYHLRTDDPRSTRAGELGLGCRLLSPGDDDQVWAEGVCRQGDVYVVRVDIVDCLVRIVDSP